MTEREIKGEPSGAGERIGFNEHFVLTAAKVRQGQGASASLVAAAGPATYRIDGLTDEQLTLHVGRRVRIDGTFGSVDRGATPADPKRRRAPRAGRHDDPPGPGRLLDPEELRSPCAYAATCIGAAGIVAATCFSMACAGTAKLAEHQAAGPAPTLVPPEKALVPTINVVTAVGWPEGATPTTADGLAVTAFARGLEHPRWIAVLPNGDVLVAETNAPPRPRDRSGLRGWLFGRAQKKAGGAVPSANRITLLRDADGDGVAEVRVGVPHRADLAVRDGARRRHALRRQHRRRREGPVHGRGHARRGSTPQKVIDLPAGDAQPSLDQERHRQPGRRARSTWPSDRTATSPSTAWPKRKDARSSGPSSSPPACAGPLRPACAIRSGWRGCRRPARSGSRSTSATSSVHDLVPDYMTAVKEGAFYGWPFSYFGSHVDTRVSPQDPERVARALVPDYALGAHTASLGLAYATTYEGRSGLTPRFATGMFVGQHGSWNRNPRSGYKVVFVPFVDGVPAGPRDRRADRVRDARRSRSWTARRRRDRSAGWPARR